MIASRAIFSTHLCTQFNSDIIRREIPKYITLNLNFDGEWPGSLYR